MNRLRHIYPLIAALLTALLVSACYEDSYVGAEGGVEETEPTFLTFDITLPLINNTRTPSSPEGGYDPGSADWENYIDIARDLHFYIFTGDDVTATNKPQFVTMLNPLATIINADASDNRGSNYKRYTVRSLVQQKLTPPFRLVALANCGEDNYPTVDGNGYLVLNGTRINSLDGLANNLTYSMPAPIAQLDENHLIPMYGVSKITQLSKIGDDTNIGRIDMLRAWAKVDICVSREEYADLESVTLHNYNTRGLICPTEVYDRGDYVKGYWGTDYVGHLSLPSNSGTKYEDYSLETHSTTRYEYVNKDDETYYEDRKVFTVYVPEYRNLGGNGLVEHPSSLSLTFDDSDTKEYPVDFKYYDDPHITGYAQNDPYNIERNNYYRFTVKRSGTTVIVEPYAGVELNPDFGMVSPVLTLNTTHIDMYPSAQNDRLTATLQRYVGTPQQFVWTTNRTGVVRIDPTSNPNEVNIVALDPGMVTITVTYGYTLSASCVVVVAEERIILNRTWIDMVVNTQETITANICCENTTNAAPTWTSSNENVVTISPDGIITAVGEGDADITATFEYSYSHGSEVLHKTLTAMCHVRVGSPSISLSNTTYDIATGTTKQLYATIWPANYTSQRIRWTSSNTAVAKVNSEGAVEGIHPGTATITATCDGLTTTCTVNVMDETVMLVPSAGSYTYNSTNGRTTTALTLKTPVQMQVISVPAGHVWTVDSSKWTTSNSTYLTINAGVAERIKAGGSPYITVTATREDGITKTLRCNVNVKD